MRLLSAIFISSFLTPALAPALALASVPQVMTSIAPLAGIAAAVMEGAGTPSVLVKGNASPHTYQLTPQDAAALSRAQLVLWVGEGLENFLEKPLATLAEHAEVIELLDAPGLEKLPTRQGGLWEPEADDDNAEHGHGHEHTHGAIDPHLWLAPDNAAKIAALLADHLAALDVEHATLYHDNAKRFAARLVTLDADLKARLAPVQNRPYIVFHDAYQYFEHHYGLKGAGAITLSPEEQPSAARVAAMRNRLAAQQIACVYAEPQFSPALLRTLTEHTKAGQGTLNPDASDLPITPDLYPAYLSRLVEDFLACSPQL